MCVCVCVCVYVRVYENGGRETADTDELKGGIALGERERERKKEHILQEIYQWPPQEQQLTRRGKHLVEQLGDAELAHASERLLARNKSHHSVP